MTSIKVLDPKVVARIAAGEVVERPSSVVKELVENALDAGASQIVVEVRGGGIDLIRVTDNGTGINSEEVALAFERHATSKIAQLEDLESLASLGFRGEALPSIAAVAEIELTTHTGDESSGSYILLKDGAIAGQRAQGRAQGTTVAVRNLFRQVPARLKFLKSPAAEGSHIANIVSQYALAYPEVRFELSMEGRTTLSTTGSSRLRDAVTAVYGVDMAAHMLEVKGGEAEWQAGKVLRIKVDGLAGAPQIGRGSRNYISFFVNRRWINSRLLTRALEEAYHGLLMQGKHPVAVINIMLPASEVDVNVHPAKTEVKFRDEQAVFSAVERSVRRALMDKSPVTSIEEVAVAYRAPPNRLQSNGWSTPSPALELATGAESTTVRQTLPVLRVIGQMADSYIVAEGPDGLYVIDQHAAHERIAFEQIKEKWSQRQVEVQGLLTPVSFEVSAEQEATLRERLDDLKRFGFEIELFGPRGYLVRSVPRLLSSKDWAAALHEMIDSEGSGNDWLEQAIASMACHGAVRAGQTLSLEEMRELVRQLEQTDLPQSCPHGRPTLLHLSQERLSREFGR